jgi:nucleoside-triphosphatase
METGKRVRRILITGSPGSGKTTLVERLISNLDVSAYGFLTREIRENGRRVGFELIGLSGEKCTIAHVDLASSHKVGRYGVDVSSIDTAVNKELIAGSGNIVFVDEIGKMELFSKKFRDAITSLWDSDKFVVATIMAARNAFCDRLKADHCTAMYELSPDNRDNVYSDTRNHILKNLVTGT